MDLERIIDEIEQLEEIFEAPDIRPLSASDISAANRRHDEVLASSPVVPFMAAVWRLLPTRIACAPTAGNGELTLPRMDVRNGEEVNR